MAKAKVEVGNSNEGVVIAVIGESGRTVRLTVSNKHAQELAAKLMMASYGDAACEQLPGSEMRL